VKYQDSFLRLLVSNGALAFAQERELACISPDTLICDRALDEWKMWKERLASTDTPHGATSAIVTSSSHNIQDTVGAVAWGSRGDLAAGVSRCPSSPFVLLESAYEEDSGGLLLKYPGRIGEVCP
jgi:taspase, threonine aspartase, 1